MIAPPLATEPLSHFATPSAHGLGILAEGSRATTRDGPLGHVVRRPLGHSATRSLAWRVWCDMDRDVTEQMALDERLAREAQPLVRLFVWNAPAISLGLKQSPPDWLLFPPRSSSFQLPASSFLDGVAVVRRPTGGGLGLHGSDVCMAVVVSWAGAMPLAQLMRAVCDSAVAVCRAFGVEAERRLRSSGGARVAYCLAEPADYSILAGGRKLAGFAVRRYRESWLIQGSLLVRPLPALLRLALPPEVSEALEAQALSLAEAAPVPLDEQDVMQCWAEQWPGVLNAV